MDKLIEKHDINCQKMHCVDAKKEHANITKEVAIGFADWLQKDYVGLTNPPRWSHDTDSRKDGTTSELFAIYLESL